MLYTYRCPQHGDFDQQATMANRNLTVLCACGVNAPRQEVYGLTFKMEGQTMPPRDDAHNSDLHDELGKVMKRRGYGGKDEAIQDVRDNMVTDEQGNKTLNRAGMRKAV